MCLLANVLSVSLTVIGLAGFVMMIVGSLTWLLSGGSSQNVEKARKTMTFAIIGLVVALSSYMIIHLIAEFTGISILEEFTLPSSETNWTSPTPTP
jgi:membrane-bound ClpP family serine protease